MELFEDVSSAVVSVLPQVVEMCKTDVIRESTVGTAFGVHQLSFAVVFLEMAIADLECEIAYLRAAIPEVEFIDSVNCPINQSDT